MPLRLTSLLSFLAIAALPSAATAQSWRSQLDRQIASSSLLTTLASSGYQQSHEVTYGTLRSGTDTSITFRVSPGRRYAFVGFCDNDCGDVDLYLYDASGTLVERDVLVDDEPLVRGQPAEGGTYRLRISMASCSTSFCGWAVVSRGERPAEAPGWMAEIERQFNSHRIVTSSREAGFSASGDVKYGLLEDGEVEPVEFTLVGGRTYRFIGLCDSDCSDLDLRVLDASGNRVAQDIASDDYPVATFTPLKSGVYTVRVTMASCSTEPCGWGVQAFSR